MKSENAYRITVIVLLTGILAVQSAVLVRINKGTEVNVKNPSLEVRLDPLAIQPTLDVHVGGQPIEVQIVR